MSNWFSRLSLNQRLALLAFVLGAVAISATPTRQARVSINRQELALIVQKGADDVTVHTLADHLVKGENDFRVIDVRDEAAYAAYHVPSAENVPIATLVAAGLPRTEKLLLYADDGVRAAQAWFLLKAEGYRGVYILRGGLAAWRDEVLSPLLPETATAEQRQANDRRAAVAAFFGGAPRQASAATAGGATASGPALAAAAPPPPPVAVQLPKTAPRPTVVKKKEGC